MDHVSIIYNINSNEYFYTVRGTNKYVIKYLEERINNKDVLKILDIGFAKYLDKVKLANLIGEGMNKTTLYYFNEWSKKILVVNAEIRVLPEIGIEYKIAKYNFENGNYK